MSTSQSESQPISQSAAETAAPNADNTSQPEPAKIELPGYFEDVVLDDLVVLIGQWFVPCTHCVLTCCLAISDRIDEIADLLQRMIVLNDQIPLSA